MSGAAVSIAVSLQSSVPVSAGSGVTGSVFVCRRSLCFEVTLSAVSVATPAVLSVPLA